MYDHNLDDIIVDNHIKPKNNKSKKLLTILAIFIVILITTIISMKSILKSDTNTKSDFETAQNNITYVAPELKLKNPTEIENSQDKIDNTNIVKKDIPTIEDKKDDKKNVSIPSEPKEDSIEDKIKKQHVEITKEFEQEDRVKVKKQPIVKPKERVRRVSHTKEREHKRVRKVHKSHFKYYIQVGSFKEKPTLRSQLLTVLKKNRYRYSIYKINGLNKVLIGPYGTRKIANKSLRKVKDIITKSAYIFKK